MAKAQVRDGRLSVDLSDEMREKLGIDEGDELEAHVFPGSVSFTPTSPEMRQRAWERIFSLIDGVGVRPGQPELRRDQIEELIVEEVKAVRRTGRALPET